MFLRRSVNIKSSNLRKIVTGAYLINGGSEETRKDKLSKLLKEDPLSMCRWLSNAA